MGMGASAMCSTPLGVTDLVTCAERPAARGRSCAQRLSASQTWSPIGTVGLYFVQDVLNASRRHRLGHLDQPTEDELHEACSTPLGVTDLVTSSATSTVR